MRLLSQQVCKLGGYRPSLGNVASIAILASIALSIPLSPATADSGSAPSAGAATPTPVAPAAPLPLTVVKDSTLTSADGSYALVDFKTASLLDVKTIDHTFKIKNDNKTPVVIQKLVVSCHCTSALPGKMLPLTLAPGETTEVTASVNTAGFSAGPIDKRIQVYLDGQDQSSATLEIKGTLLSGADFYPQTLDFGHVKAGQKLKPMYLTLAYDPRIAFDNKVLSGVVSTNPDIKVELQKKAMPPKDAALDPHMTLKTFRVSVQPNVSLGPIQATIAMPQPSPGKYTTSVMFRSVWVTGFVDGDISASTSAIEFGQMEVGKTYQQLLVLTGHAPNALDNLKVTTDNPDITVTVLPKDKPAANLTAVTSGSDDQITLQLTTAPKSASALQSKMTIQTQTGQRLVCSVLGWVFAAPTVSNTPNATPPTQPGHYQGLVPRQPVTK